jgi:cytochrome c-type biogenesis protein CcmH/NrfF
MIAVLNICAILILVRRRRRRREIMYLSPPAHGRTFSLWSADLTMIVVSSWLFDKFDILAGLMKWMIMF